jgi:hypothetical protein
MRVSHATIQELARSDQRNRNPVKTATTVVTIIQTPEPKPNARIALG